jgi:hypothetical protein
VPHHLAQVNVARLRAPLDSPQLADFAYRSDHKEVMRRRREWFEKMAEPYLALWWVPAGHVPTVEEAEERLLHLRAHGPTEHAFTFREPFPPRLQVGEAEIEVR